MSKHPVSLKTIALSAFVLASALSSKGEQTVMPYDKSDGLSNGYVVSIAQDGDGYVWVATEDGLNRFDGTSFKALTKENSGLTANEFNAVAYHPAYPDSLWIATQRDGMCVYDRTDGSIHPLTAAVKTPEIISVAPASDKGLWLGHYHFGAQYFNPSTGESKYYDSETIPGLPRQVWNVTDAGNGKIYLGHTHDGLSVVDTLSRTFTNISKEQGLPGSTVYDICVDRRNYIWVGTENGVARINPVTFDVLPFVHHDNDRSSIGAGQVQDIIQAKDGSLWFATSRGGVSVLDASMAGAVDPSRIRFTSLPLYAETGGTSGSNIRSLFQDSYGNIWIGNYRTGIDVVGHIDPVFSHVPYFNDMSRRPVYKPVWSVASDGHGIVWLGGENEIIRYDGDKCTTIPLHERPNSDKAIVRALEVDKDGRLWIGTAESGCVVYTPDGNLKRVGGSDLNVRVLRRSPSGKMLIGTSNGIYMADGDNFVPFDTINNQLWDNVLQDILFDSKGNMWVGTFGKGLAVFDKENKEIASYRVTNGFISNAVNAIREDSKGRVWVATRNGVALFDHVADGKPVFSTVSSVTDAGVTHVKSVEEDFEKNIWLSTNKGLMRLDGETLRVIFSGTNDEIANTSFIENGSLAGDNGILFFCSNDGAISADYRAMGQTLSKLPVRVTDLEISGERQNTFAISFNILDPSMVGLVELAYRLEGLSDDWAMAGPDNSVIFRDLPPGKYKFLVKQRFNSSEWSDPAAIYSFEVKPPVWQTWWAKLCYVIIALGIIFIVAMYYKKRVNLRKELEIERENNRNRQSLNEERLRFYTNVTHELRTPLTLIMGPLEDLVSDPSLPSKYSYKLQTIRDSSATLLNLINGILEFRKTETQNRQLTVKHGKLGNLVREIGLRYKELNRNDDVEFILDIEDNDPTIFFDADIITTILNNLLSNAMKYTRKGSITLSYHIVDEDGTRKSVIKVADTGYGIARKNIDHIFERYYQENSSHQASGTGIGLALVKNLSDIHEAVIDVTSKEGKGSVFLLTLDTDNIYPNALHTEQEKPQESVCEASAEINGGDKRRRLLVVEDNDDIREYISQALSDTFEVITASNGLDGLRKAQQEHPDIIVSDVMMPEMDGVTMCASLKEDILTSHIPIILLTAKDSLADREAGYEAGADSYLTKPFTAKLLRSRINSIIRIRRTIAEQYMNQSVQPQAENTEIPEHAEAAETQSVSVVEPPVAQNLSALDRQFMEKIISIINENFGRYDLGVAFLADKMCMSNSTLYRKINALLGVSTNEYIRHVRLSRAVEMLMEGTLSVTEIAERTGFGSHSSFAKAFKKEYGMTATEYISKHTNQPNNKP